jgi:hypothetical protein
MMNATLYWLSVLAIALTILSICCAATTVLLQRERAPGDETERHYGCVQTQAQLPGSLTSRPPESTAYNTPQSVMSTTFNGTSAGSVSARLITSISSMLFPTTSPNTTCFPSRCGAAAVVMKTRPPARQGCHKALTTCLYEITPPSIRAATTPPEPAQPKARSLALPRAPCAAALSPPSGQTGTTACRATTVAESVAARSHWQPLHRRDVQYQSQHCPAHFSWFCAIARFKALFEKPRRVSPAQHSPRHVHAQRRRSL